MPRTRRVALVGPVTVERRAVHTAGYPIDPDSMLPMPDVVLVVDSGKGGCMLFRYSAHGELCGDTPHDSVQQAEMQAQIEYGDALYPWVDVPRDVQDAHAFAVRYASDQLNQRE
jgi:hypothetical protein